MLQPLITRNDRMARALILAVSFVVFIAIVILGKVQVPVNEGFDVHIFARINAVINSIVSLLLLAGIISVRRRRYNAHRNIMLAAIVLSVLFLVSYICHHLFAGDTRYGGEGAVRYVYYFVLITHIILAAVILPFILFTAYRGMTAEWPRHRAIARITWPVWLYVSVSGVIVYLFISPYY